MNIEKFADMLLKSIEKMEMPVADVQQIKTDNSLLGVEMPDDSQFLIKIGKCNTEEETLFCEMDEVGSRIHEMYEKFTNSWEYNHTLMKNKLDIDWLIENWIREIIRDWRTMYWIIVQEMTNLYFGWDSDMRGRCLLNALKNEA